MDELKIVKLAELRRKMGAIPGKLLVAVLLSFGMYCRFDVDKFMENPVQNIFLLVVMYGVVSYFWLCVRATGNWIIGFIVAVGLVFLWTYYMDKMSEWLQILIGGAICFGGAIMDILAVIRYFIIKKKVFYTESGYYEEDSGEDWEEDEEEDEEDYRENWEQRQGGSRRKEQESSSGFFTGCKDAASIKRRYKDLCKVYHPDSGNGSAEIFNKITQEYDRLMEQHADAQESR